MIYIYIYMVWVKIFKYKKREAIRTIKPTCLPLTIASCIRNIFFPTFQLVKSRVHFEK